MSVSHESPVRKFHVNSTSIPRADSSVRDRSAGKCSDTIKADYWAALNESRKYESLDDVAGEWVVRRIVS